MNQNLSPFVEQCFCPFLSLSIHLTIYNLHVFFHLSNYLSIHLTIYNLRISFHLSNYLSIHPTIYNLHVSFHLSNYLSIHLTIALFIQEAGIALINLSSDPSLAKSLLLSNQMEDLVKTLYDCIQDEECKVSDPASMILSNLTR